MNFEIQELPAMHVAFMRHTGPYASPGIGRLWQRFMEWAAAHGVGNDRHEMIGIGHDNPEVTPPAECRYDAAVEVEPGFTPDGTVQLQELPGGTYACAPFQGTSAQLGAAWQRMWDLLPREGWQPDARVGLEVYGRGFRMDPNTGAFACRLCVPVRPARG